MLARITKRLQRHPNVDPKKLEKEGEPLLFDYENYAEREKRAVEYINFIGKISRTDRFPEQAMAVRDKYFAELEQQRKSTYYKELSFKLARKEKLHPDEYFYYALVTDKINELDPVILNKISSRHWDFTQNISVLVAVREWQNAVEPEDKIEKNDRLREVLGYRGYARTHCKTYLNLHGVNLAGADLSNSGFDYTNLAHANFAGANLYNAEFVSSNLDDADFSRTKYYRPDYQREMRGTKIVRSRARHACFDGIDTNYCYWVESDFTGSSMQASTIGAGTFGESCFNDCNLDLTDFIYYRGGHEQNVTFVGANLATTKFVGIDYDKVDFTRAKLFEPADLQDSRRLSTLLDKLHREVILKISAEDSSAWYKESQITHYQKIVANNISEFMFASLLPVEKKQELLNIALRHPLFQPNSSWMKSSNTVVNEVTKRLSFWGSESANPVQMFKTPAIEILEAARTELDIRDYRITNW